MACSPDSLLPSEVENPVAEKRDDKVSITCVGEHVGLEEIDDVVWNVCFGPVKLGRFLEHKLLTNQLSLVPGRWPRLGLNSL
jgi:hypothetical protein